MIVLKQRGLIPGPDEPDANFFHRCQQAGRVETAPSSILMKDLFNIEPDWVELEYSNKGLRFWEGGFTWIEHPKVKIQLNQAFENKDLYLGIYQKEELLAHELVHVVRNHFEEPVFEEILAYQTSNSRFRRFFGPLFRNTKEVVFFFFALFGILVASIFPEIQLVAYIGMASLMAGALFRLVKSQSVFSKTRKKISSLVGESKALSVLICLSDREIKRFSKMTKEQILDYAERLGKTNLRWKIILHDVRSAASSKE